MATALKSGWSKPSTILFASEIPANEKALNFAAAQARETGACLILFHVYDTLVRATAETSSLRYFDYAAAAQTEKHALEPVALRLRAEGVDCEIVARPGLPADQILNLLRERAIDRVVMGTHSPGPLGKMLLGSVAEAVVRTACVPVCVIGPDVADARYRNYETNTILCAVSLNEASPTVVRFAAEVATEHRARLILQHVIRPQERTEVLAGRMLKDIELELLSLVPDELQNALSAEAIVVAGDPVDELLYQARAQEAEMIVMGAQGTSAFAAITRHGVVHQLLAHAHCPVMTLSPAVLQDCGVKHGMRRAAEVFLAGVF
jgi:nucleotide-binding universal stress UspA family protein